MKRGAFISAGLLTSLIAGLVLFQIPGRRFFFVRLSAADVAGRCGTATDEDHLLSKFQAALPRSADASTIPAQPFLLSPRRLYVEPPAVANFELSLPSFDLAAPVLPVFLGRAPPAIG